MLIYIALCKKENNAVLYVGLLSEAMLQSCQGQLNANNPFSSFKDFGHRNTSRSILTANSATKIKENTTPVNNNFYTTHEISLVIGVELYFNQCQWVTVTVASHSLSR